MEMWNSKKSRLETERIELLEFFKKDLRFLIDHLGYSQSLEKEFDEHPGGPKFYFLRFTNYHRKRQVEIILHRNSDYRLWTLKKLNGSSIPDYYDNENTLDIVDLALLTSPTSFDHMDHHVYTEEKKRLYVSRMTALLKNYWIPLVEGTQWIDRVQIDDISLSKWNRPSGFHRDKLLEKIKIEFRFLQDYGYQLIEDTNLLPPYEQSVSCEIVYFNSDTKEKYAMLNDYKDYGFRIDHFTSNRQKGDMLNYVSTEDQDKEWTFVARMAKWLEDRLKHGGSR